MDGLAERHHDRLEVKESENWIGWRSASRHRVFVELRPHRRKVEVFILPTRKQLKDPKKLARKAPPTQGWGWFRSRFDIEAKYQVEAAFHLIRQSYEHGLTQGNGRPAHRRRHLNGQTSL
jgi:predicted transport protein